jgi:transposase
MQIKDFTGTTIHVGIDLHKKQWNSSVYFENRLFKTFQQKPKAAELKKYLLAHFPGADYKSAYEAGYFGFAVHRQLTELGIENIVINASDIPITDKDKNRKNDKRDAKRIGKNLVNGQLEGIYVPTRQAESDRQLVRYRTKIVRKDLVITKQRIKSFLALHGIDYDEDFGNNKWSKKFICWIEQLNFDYESDRQIRDQLIGKLIYLKEEKRKVERQIVLLSRSERYQGLVRILKSIPGVGLLTAMVLITELIDMDRFKSLDKICSFVGLVPDVRASDETEKIKGITKRANKETRRVLIQASWVAAGKDPELAKAYHGYKRRMPHQKAIVKIARKLLSRIRAVWMNQQTYKM